jgi:hypothetical protein
MRQRQRFVPKHGFVMGLVGRLSDTYGAWDLACHCLLKPAGLARYANLEAVGHRQGNSAVPQRREDFTVGMLLHSLPVPLLSGHCRTSTTDVTRRAINSLYGPMLSSQRQSIGCTTRKQQQVEADADLLGAPVSS